MGLGVVHVSRSWGLEKRRFSERVECYAILKQAHISAEGNCALKDYDLGDVGVSAYLAATYQGARLF